MRQGQVWPATSASTTLATASSPAVQVPDKDPWRSSRTVGAARVAALAPCLVAATPPLPGPVPAYVLLQLLYSAGPERPAGAATALLLLRAACGDPRSCRGGHVRLACRRLLGLLPQALPAGRHGRGWEGRARGAGDVRATVPPACRGGCMHTACHGCSPGVSHLVRSTHPACKPCLHTACRLGES